MLRRISVMRRYLRQARMLLPKSADWLAGKCDQGSLFRIDVLGRRFLLLRVSPRNFRTSSILIPAGSGKRKTITGRSAAEKRARRSNFGNFLSLNPRRAKTPKRSCPNRVRIVSWLRVHLTNLRVGGYDIDFGCPGSGLAPPRRISVTTRIGSLVRVS